MQKLGLPFSVLMMIASFSLSDQAEARRIPQYNPTPEEIRKTLLRKVRRQARRHSDSPQFLKALVQIVELERGECEPELLLRDLRRLKRANDIATWYAKAQNGQCAVSTKGERMEDRAQAEKIVRNFANPEIIECTRGELSIKAAIGLGLAATAGGMICKFTDYTTRIYVGGGPGIQWFGGATVSISREHYDNTHRAGDEDGVEEVGKVGAYFEDYNTDLAFFRGFTENAQFSNRQVSSQASMKEAIQQTESVSVGMGVLGGFSVKPYVAIVRFTRWKELGL